MDIWPAFYFENDSIRSCASIMINMADIKIEWKHQMYSTSVITILNSTVNIQLSSLCSKKVKVIEMTRKI